MLKYLTIFFFFSFTTLFSFNYNAQDTVKSNVDSTLIDSVSNIETAVLSNITKTNITNVSSGNFILRKDDINKRDYRFTGNIISYLPFGFIHDLGTNGQPHQINIFGNGYNSVSYFRDGIFLNNRINNNYDLNYFQSERIDSVELIPVSQGFLYGNYNNTAAVNFITRDSAVTSPTTRLRYYQAPEDEEFVNLSFKTKIFDPLYFSVNLTNYTVEPRFENSESGGWKINYRFKYLLTMSTNIILNYNSVSTETQLFGGVDAVNKNNIEYDFQLAEVVYPFSDFSSRYQKYKQDFITFTVLSKLFNQYPLTMDLYYIFSKKEFRQNERTNITGIKRIVNDNSINTLGLSLSQKFKSDKFRATIISAYERNNFTADILSENITQNFFNVSSIVEKDFNKSIIASIFAKYLNDDNESYFGFGGNLNYSFGKNISLFAGYSLFEKPIPLLYNSLFQPGLLYGTPGIKIFESSIKYSASTSSVKLSFFTKENNNALLPLITSLPDTSIVNEVGMFKTVSSNQKGFNINFDIQLWKILFQGNMNYYPDFRQNTAITPEYNFAGGLYYIDTLFNNNLKLKAGFNFYSIGQQYYYEIDFQNNIPYKYYFDGVNSNLLKNEYTDLVNTVDLFISGTFQDAAVVNFVFENILDQQYFISPYYPKQGQGIRLSINWEILN